MIKYFRRLGLVRVTELALGLLVIATALLIITGGDVFESGRHINLAKLDEEDIKAGMYVEIDVNEILNVYGDDNKKQGSYYIIPFPHTEENYDNELTLMAVFVPQNHKSEADAIMLSTASNIGVEDQLSLNGRFQEMSDEEKKLFDACIAKTKEDYALSDVNVLPYCFITVEMNWADYLATAFAAAVVIWYICMLAYLLSNRNQQRVAHFIKVNELDEQAFMEEINNASKFGKVILSDNYIAFMIRYTVSVVKRSDVDTIFRLEHKNNDPASDEVIKEDVIIIKQKDNEEYIVPMREENIIKLLNSVS